MMKSEFGTDEARFLDSALGRADLPWNRVPLEQLADLQVPERLLGQQRFLLKADVRFQWARWFLESLVDPSRYAGQRASYARIREDISRFLRSHADYLGKDERKELASVVARILLDLVIRAEASRHRKRLSAGDRWRLLDFAGTPPRCWICGTKFNAVAVENFRSGERNAISPPLLVDILKPRGLLPRDLAIEVDHIIPHSQGGGERDNLALACGWCNRYKGARTSVYDVEGRPRVAGRNAFGVSSLPQPFWTVRLLATVRKCEHPEGCQRSAYNSDVTVVPVHETGALNPSNLRVTCYEHDPYKEFRLQSHGVVQGLWAG